ncbi:uncharacterized protein LOC105211198 [Zeugodacus cucurbitae]|nr:uncharacterized protein LOC105211198 [Zeugodacus cucurbitae]
MYYTLSLFAILLGATVQNAKSRTITISVNMSLTMDEERHRDLLEARQQQLQQEQARPALTAAVLRSCMKETELSMAELHRFRLSLLSRDPEVLNGTNDPTTELPNLSVMEEFSEYSEIDGIVYEPEVEINASHDNALEYEDPFTFKSNENTDESLQCFAYCLYEQLGLISKGVYMEEELFAKLYAIVGRERHLVKECMNLNTNNKCESSYKMHLCYARLKTLEEENRLRKLMEDAYNGERDDEESEEIPQAETTQETYVMNEIGQTESTFPVEEDAITENVGIKKKLKKLKKKSKRVDADAKFSEMMQNWAES